VVEEFDTVGEWTYTNGAGIQNYGDGENYATFNVGFSPYENDAIIEIISPILDFSLLCPEFLTVSFPVSGVIEENSDIMYFEYYENFQWITHTSFTGYQDNSLVSYNLPIGTTRIRFRLITDGSLIRYYTTNLTDPQPVPDLEHPVPVDISNTYVAGRPLIIQVYYYDISVLYIECGTSLPIELISFTGEAKNGFNQLNWITASELNNDFFTVEKSLNILDFEEVGKISGAGNSNTTLSYSMIDNHPTNTTYYRLKQTDFNGDFKYSDIIVVNRNNADKSVKIVKIYNLLGQEVSENYTGIKVYRLNDGSIVKKFGINFGM